MPPFSIGTAALIGGGVGAAGSMAGGALSFFGAQSQAKASRQAAETYRNYINEQRNTFLKENAPVAARLRSMIPGTAEYNPEADPTLKTIGENYGQGLRDVQRDVLGSGVRPGGVYTPGGSDRTAMLLGQNLTASKAQMMRDTQMNNEKYATAALPTYSAGLPATPMPSESSFMAGIPPAAGSFMGPAINQAAQTGVQLMGPSINAQAMGPVWEKIYGATKGTQPALNSSGYAVGGGEFGNRVLSGADFNFSNSGTNYGSFR